MNSDIASARYLMPDLLRGIALMGICLANFSEFSLYSFLPASATAAMPSASIDTVVRYLQYLFIDGKFYTIFSLLFGVGFSIFFTNALKKKRNGILLFYRRMTILFLFGLAHLIFLWAGDILILYAFLGFFLPLFRNISDKKLIIAAIILLLIPILIDTCISLFDWNLSAPVIQATQYFHAKAGITPENFPIWLANAQHYTDILSFNIAGSFIRMQEFIECNRAFKVMGLFLIGFYIGRKRFYAQLGNYSSVLQKIMIIGFVVGLPLSALYAWNMTHNVPLKMAASAALYTFSVFPLSFAYMTAICLIYIKWKESASISRRIAGGIAHIVALTGRMALTNYIMQSVFGILIFYGIGLGWGAKTGIVHAELIALTVFSIQVIYSYLWLKYFRFGPMEWSWRILTYGEWLSIKKIINKK
ncbi:MAG: DUF418 domain-containing protein [Tannerella sp.]|nr:DUF418 domain-containing protein [Tannerella sp.]